MKKIRAIKGLTNKKPGIKFKHPAGAKMTRLLKPEQMQRLKPEQMQRLKPEQMQRLNSQKNNFMKTDRIITANEPTIMEQTARRLKTNYPKTRKTKRRRR
jgi:hypothetical protein